MSKIRVNKTIYRIVYKDFGDRLARGFINYKDRIIGIDKKLSAYLRLETKIHEIQHAIQEENGIKSTDIMTAEKFIERTNPLLVKTLIENNLLKNRFSFEKKLAIFCFVFAIIVAIIVNLPRHYCVPESGKNIYDMRTHKVCTYKSNKNIIEALILKNL